MTADNVLCKVGWGREKKKIQATPTKQDFGYSKGFFSKFSTSSFVPFYNGVPPGE